MKKRNFKVLVCCLLLTAVIAIQPLAVSAAELWVFKFEASNTFPNPVSRNSALKERMELLVLDKDFKAHPATIRSEVYNAAGQLIYTKTEVHDSSPSFDMVVWQVGNVASGRYIIKTRAETSAFGNSGWVERKCVVY